MLALPEDPLDELLWKGHLDIVAFGEGDDSVPQLAQRLEIFLDALLRVASEDHSHRPEIRSRVPRGGDCEQSALAHRSRAPCTDATAHEPDGRDDDGDEQDGADDPEGA